MTIALAIIFALFIWWASTVAIIYLDGLKPHTFKYSLAGMTVVTIASLYGLYLTKRGTYALKHFTTATDIAVVMGARAVALWKESHGA